jgi:hypothetical protein
VVQAGGAGAWVARAYLQTPDAGTSLGVDLWEQTGKDSAPITLGN